MNSEETLERCDICGNGTFRRRTVADAYHNGTFEIYKCLACGVGILFPVPAFEELEREYYSQNYHAYLSMGVEGAHSFAGKVKHAIKRAVLDTYLGYGQGSVLGYVAYPFFFRIPFYPQRVVRGTYLDVGCGSGVQLLHMKELGWDVYGIDLSETALSVARKNGIEQLSQGTLIDVDFPDKKFDVINFTHVLEHVPNPHEILKNAHRILRDDGTLVIAVPNFEGIGNRLFGRYSEYDVPRHLHQFTLKSLKVLLKENGFTIQEQYRNDVLRGFMHAFSYVLRAPARYEKYFIAPGRFLDLFIEPFLVHTSLGSQIIIKAKKS
jgi:2-polyprenyl-3-methyl-5-hydroxy-6-metoxy-1,4-benzoquinol methylase